MNLLLIRHAAAATMREMFSIGVASAHTGIPLHGVRTKRKSIQKAFDTTSIGKDEQLVAVTSVSHK